MGRTFPSDWIHKRWALGALCFGGIEGDRVEPEGFAGLGPRPT